MTDTYTQKVMDHFDHPRNVGELPDADVQIDEGSPECGDYIRIWVKAENQKIINFRYKVFGCAAAIATTSAVSEMAIGLSFDDALEMTDDDVIRYLGGLPSGKQHCSLMGVNALHKAVWKILAKENHQRYLQSVTKYRNAGIDFPLLCETLLNRLALPETAVVLDIGAGKGHMAIALAQRGFKCTSIDLDENELRFARLNALYFGVADRIQFERENATSTEYEDDTFDAVVSFLSLHHCTQTEPLLEEMVRMCKPGGQIILCDLNESGLQTMQDVHARENRKHRVFGWSVSTVREWFESRQFACKFQRLEKVWVLYMLIP